MGDTYTQNFAETAQWSERQTRDRKVAGSSPGRSGGRIYFSRVNLFHPRVTAVTRKRSRAFCQKCRWRVTDKHTSTLLIWLCMKWHDMVHGCMEHTELARYGSSFTWHRLVTTKPSCKYTASVDIQIRYNLKKQKQKKKKSDSESLI